MSLSYANDQVEQRWSACDNAGLSTTAKDSFLRRYLLPLKALGCLRVILTIFEHEKSLFKCSPGTWNASFTHSWKAVCKLMQKTYSKIKVYIHLPVFFPHCLRSCCHVAMLSPDFLLLPCIYCLETIAGYILVTMQTQGESCVFSLVDTIHNLYTVKTLKKPLIDLNLP